MVVVCICLFQVNGTKPVSSFSFCHKEKKELCSFIPVLVTGTFAKLVGIFHWLQWQRFSLPFPRFQWLCKVHGTVEGQALGSHNLLSFASSPPSPKNWLRKWYAPSQPSHIQIILLCYYWEVSEAVFIRIALCIMKRRNET